MDAFPLRLLDSTPGNFLVLFQKKVLVLSLFIEQYFNATLNKIFNRNATLQPADPGQVKPIVLAA